MYFECILYNSTRLVCWHEAPYGRLAGEGVASWRGEGGVELWLSGMSVVNYLPQRRTNLIRAVYLLTTGVTVPLATCRAATLPGGAHTMHFKPGLECIV